MFQNVLVEERMGETGRREGRLTPVSTEVRKHDRQGTDIVGKWCISEPIEEVAEGPGVSLQRKSF